MFERKRWHRITAILLVLTMLFTSIPAMAFAESTGSEEPDAGETGKSEETLLMEENLQLEESVSEDNIIDSENTTESTTFDLGNGKRMIIYHGQDVRYETEEGKLEDYDSSLVELKAEESETGENLSDYAFENRKGDIKHYIPQSLKEETPVITENGKYSLSMVPIDETVEKQPVKKEKEPVLMPYEEVKEKQIRAVYKSEKKKHSYAYSSLNQGIKETIILEENPENNVFLFRINVKGMTAELDEKQNLILFKDKKTEKTVASIDKPFMNDASGEAYSEDLVYALEEEKSGSYLLTLTISRKYLDDEDRLYPVSIDPTATWKGSEEFLDAYVISGDYADINFYDSDVRLMVVGKGIDGTYRTYIKLPNIKSTLEDKYVDSAYLTVYESGDCDPDQTIRLNRITESWSPSTITWSNKPTYYSDGYINNFTTDGKQYAAHKVTMTNTVRNYVNSTNNPNYGIVMRNVTSSPEFAEFYGSRTSLTSYRPKLVVTYYDKPTVADTVAVSRKSGDEYIDSIYLRKGYNKYVSWTGIVSQNLSAVQYKIIGLDDTPDPTSVSSDKVDLSSYRSIGVATKDGSNVKVPYGSYLPAGRYRIYIRGKDAGGMYGTAKYKNFYVDEAPEVTGVSISPSTSSTQKTNNLRPVVKWTSSATHFDEVLVKINGKIDSAAPTGSGSKSYTVSSGMISGDGTHTIVITAYDLAGNSTSVEKSYYVDKSAPGVTLDVSPKTASGSSTKDTTPTVNWKITGSDVNTQSLTINGTSVGSITDAEGSWSGTTGIKEGENVIKLTATDKTGNTASVQAKYYLDTTKPVVDSFSVVPDSGTASMSNDATPVINWTVTEKEIKEVFYSIDSGAFTKAGSSNTGTLTLPGISADGSHTIKFKAVDQAGNESTVKSVSYYLDKTKPSFTKCAVNGVSKEIDANSTTPKIEWQVSDTNLQNVSYSIDGGNYTSMGSTASGNYTIPAGKLTTTKDYTIRVKATDKAGNISAVQEFTYKLDLVKPSGTIKTTLPATGSEATELCDTVNISITGTDANSGVTALLLTLYKVTKTTDSSGNVKETETAVKSFDETPSNENYDLNTKNYGNGSYRLKLVVKDKAGNTATISKDVIILNRVAAPTVTSTPGNTGIVKVHWNLSEPEKYTKLQYRLDSSTEWKDGQTLNGSDASGTFSMQLPDAEGTYKVYIRGIDTDGAYGKETSVSCIFDQTVPTVTLQRYAAGYLNGTVSDALDINWEIFIKEKAQDDSAYQKLSSGNQKVEQGQISFVDLSAKEAGKEYTLKLVATDAAGNTGEDTLDIYKAPGAASPAEQTAGFRIERPAGQESSYEDTNLIVLPSEIPAINLTEEGIFGSYQWYVDNRLVSGEEIYQDDFTTGENKSYQEDKQYHILVIRESMLGEKSYSSNWMKDGLFQKISLSEETVTENEVIKQLDLNESKVLSLSLSDEIGEGTQGVTYYLKAEGHDYVEILPNQKFHIADIFPGIAYAEELTLKAVPGENAVLQDISVSMDILVSSKEEYFEVSYVENFRPENLSVVDKINYKTYIKWTNEITEDTPDNLYYEVYRSTDESFSPDSTSIVATGIRAGYAAEININYAAGFRYKVRAVEKKNGKLKYSSDSNVKYSQVVDSDEYTKRMGVKEYWAFAEVDIPNGDLSVEKSMGNLVYEQIDASLPNEQLAVELTRTYNSQSSAKSAFGIGWTHDYDIELLNVCSADSVNDDNIVMKDGSGTIYHFIKEGETYNSSLGKFISLEKDSKKETVKIPLRNSNSDSGNNEMKEVIVDSAYAVKTKDNLEYRFNSGGQLVYLQESNGNFILFEYEPEKGLLQRAVTNRNTAIEFFYHNGGDGKSDPLTVSEIRLPDGSSVAYEYEGDASKENTRLVKVTEKGVPDENGKVETVVYTYGYDNQKIPNVIEFSDGKDNKYNVTYNSKDQVDTIKYPDGEFIQLSYGTETAAALATDTEDVTSLENLGFTTETVTRRYSKGAVVSEEIDRFNGFGNCTYSKDTDGNVTKYVYSGHLLEETVEDVSYHYIDSAGYVQVSSEPKKEETQYNAKENETQQVEDDGGVTTFEYDETAPDTWDDYPTSEVETAVVNGETKTVFNLEYEYDDAGNETLETDSVSGTTTITEYYNQDSGTGLKGEVKCEKEYLGNPDNEANLQSVTTYTYTYDQNGNKTETTTQICGTETIVTTVTYDIMGREVSNTDSRGKRTDFLYDGLGRLIKTTYTDGDIVTYTETGYDNNGNVTYTRAENGVETSYAFDSMNREISRTVTKGAFEKTWTTTYGYENVTIYTGKGTETETIPNAFVITETDPEGYVTAKTWQNHKGQVVRKLENGVYVDLTYDDQGNVFTQYEIGKEQNDNKGLITMFIYDDAGNLTTTALNPVYTANGFYTKGADTIVQKSEFDASGNETASIDGEGYRTEYSYDVEGNVTEVVLPDGSVTSAQYDVLNADGTTTDIITDALGRTSRTVSDKGDLQTYVEDAGDGSVNPISMSYQYDANENVVKETDAEGNHITYLYDGKGRKTEARHYRSDGTLTYITRYTYESEASDNLKVMADYTVSGGSETLLRYTWYDYDELDRMTAMAELDGPATPTDSQIAAAKITYNYDFDDNITEITYPDHGNGIRKVKFEYNEFKWPTRVLADTESKTNLTVREYNYNNDGKLKSVTDYRGILTGEEGYILKEYGYDSFERVTGIAIKDSSDLETVRESYAYSYDKNSNILTERIINNYPSQASEKTDELRSHTYDCNGRLVKTVVSYPNNSGKSAVTYTYSYDAVGNRTAETESSGAVEKGTEYEYNSLNQLISSIEFTGEDVTSQKAYLYDKTGNQIQETDSVTSEVREQTYDVAGNMTRLVKKKGKTIELTQENQYNGNGQRIRKYEADDVTRYFYQSDSVLYTADETDKLTSWNLLGSSGNAIGTTRGTGTAEEYYLYTKDIRESTSNIIDDTGAGVVSYQYDDFGETETFGDKDFFNEICYTGGIHDASTGIYYLNARYYDPASGVFLSQDSYRGELNDPASLNLYGYCQGNPITYTDPSGHIPLIAAAIWGVRIIKTAKTVYKTAKTVKKVYKAAKTVKKITKTASTAKKTYKAAKAGKKVVRATKKVKSSKRLKKITNKVYKPSRIKKASVKAQKKKQQLRANYKQGKDAEKALAKEVGDKKVKSQTFSINNSKRVVDHLSRGVAYESKTGYICASNFVKQQVAKDAALLKAKKIKKAVWVFRKSAKTGKGGPSKALAELLRKNNIKIRIVD